ncbi:MAG: exopolysaccharide biosynthesis polyprenyl glycosylphosphotransferase [Thermoleophilia bacterium]|nr:exopolysaccharide biosynthesis polyprenyl glycosylphosphotransferase [Thermoleophilia bacterium]
MVAETPTVREPDAYLRRPEEPAPARPSSPGGRAGYVYHRLLAVSDLVAILVAAFLAVGVANRGEATSDSVGYAAALVASIPVWFVIAYAGGLYHQVDRRIYEDYVDEIGPIVVSATAWAWVFVLISATLVPGAHEFTAPMLMWILMIGSLLVFRAVLRTSARSRSWNLRPVASIGDAFGLSALSERMERHPEWSLDVRCEFEMDLSGNFLLYSSNEAGDVGRRSQHKLSTEEMIDRLIENDVERAIIAGGSGSFSMRSKLVRKLVENGIIVDFVAGGPETFYPSTSLHHLEGMAVMSMRPSRQQPLAASFKRALDILVSASFLIVASPVLMFSALAIRLDSPGPVIFRQPRGGRNGGTFDVVKLRTMAADADLQRDELRSQGHGNNGGMLKIDRDPRITRVGNYLRNWSIDEIPQLWNVLVGDMSLVGPRPLPLDESSLVSEDFKVREKMRPGITGPWQVMGRSDIPMHDMLKLDYTYVIGWTLIEDLKLLLRTITAVTRRTGAR